MLLRTSFSRQRLWARPARYRAGLVVVGAYAKHLVQQRAGVRRRAVLGRGCARNLFPCLARGLRRALPSDVEGCGGISEAPTFLVLLSHKSTNRPSMLCSLNEHRLLPLLSACPRFPALPSCSIPRPRLLTSPRTYPKRRSTSHSSASAQSVANRSAASKPWPSTSQ